MKVEEFFAVLSRTRNWTIDSQGFIRKDDSTGYHCPITAVCRVQTGKIYFPSDWKEAAQLLSLDINMAREIVNAADGAHSKYTECIQRATKTKQPTD